jgi:carotenoid 1,2-hydratase
VTLPRTKWRMAREIRATNPTIAKTLEDTPFYARSVIAAEFEGAPVTAMHESLALDRFTQPWVQAMLPFRMPRR